MQIRSATIDDATGIASVHVSSWQSVYRGSMPDEYLDNLNVEERARSWRNRLGQSGIDTFVAELERIAGFCTLTASRDADASPRTGEITALYVDPALWRRGVGRQLLATAISEARRRSFRHLTLWVLQKNSRARLFYETLGFRPDGHHKTDSTLIGHSLNEVRYLLDLESQGA